MPSASVARETPIVAWFMTTILSYVPSNISGAEKMGRNLWKTLSILSGLFNGKRSINFVKQITENFAIKSDVAETASITHLKYFLDI